MRLGLANDEVSKAVAFSSVGYQYRFAKYVFGVGLARAYLSSEVRDDNAKDTEQYELYLRYAVTPMLYFTADLQNIVNSDFIASETNQSRRDTVFGLRLSWLFD